MRPNASGVFGAPVPLLDTCRGNRSANDLHLAGVVGGRIGESEGARKGPRGRLAAMRDAGQTLGPCTSPGLAPFRGQHMFCFNREDEDSFSSEAHETLSKSDTRCAAVVVMVCTMLGRMRNAQNNVSAGTTGQCGRCANCHQGSPKTPITISIYPRRCSLPGSPSLTNGASRQEVPTEIFCSQEEPPTCTSYQLCMFHSA